MKIEAKGICCSYGQKKVLENISFLLPKEELVVLVGLNGSGKTSLMRILMGFQQPDKGEVWYEENEITELSVKERAKKIAYMPQTYKTEIYYTVEEFILLGITPYLSFFQRPRKRERERVSEILKEFGLFRLKDRTIDSLSGGERQYIYFARAKVQSTAWMILDEPMASLDYKRQHQFMEQIKAYKKNFCQGILLSVHDPNYALISADRVLLLKEGELLAVITREEGAFETKLTEGLREIYGDALTLARQESQYFYYWKENREERCLNGQHTKLCKSREFGTGI